MTEEKHVNECERCEEKESEMPNLMVEMDYPGKDISSFIATGIEIARLELEGKHLVLETNGEEGNMYLEIVEYHVNAQGDYMEKGFSDPIYDMPKTTEAVESLLDDWLDIDGYDFRKEHEETFTGGKEECDEDGYRYWSYENGKRIKALSPAFPDRRDFMVWMEQHYQ